MCGIAAIAGVESSESIRRAIESMVSAQTHRGPDDRGVVLIPTQDVYVALGNRRLAIQDISPLGHMPMRNPDTGDLITYNGEIYNAPELREELQQAGFAFAGHSDTEVILRAYQRWGLDCLNRFKGMFAIALWDARQKCLLAARDYLGIKPLYYACGGRCFLCASEVRALLASRLVDANIERRSLASFLAYGAVQEPLTIIRGIFALPPAGWMRVDAQGRIVASGKYWHIPQPDSGQRVRSHAAILEEGEAMLEHSVRRHVLSDLPVGVFLSSGLDSTAVLGLTRKVVTGDLHAFTVSFPEDPRYDELRVARDSARRLGVTHHECRVNAATCLEWANQGLERMDQPAMDGLNTYIVSRAVRDQGFAVALSGQGGDEIFGGYRSYRGVPRLHRFMKTLGPLIGIPRMLSALVPATLFPVKANKLRDMFRTGASLAGLCFQYRRLLSNEDLSKLELKAEDLQLQSSYHVPEVDIAQYESADGIASVARLESVFYLGNMLLRDGDVFGMANSLEIRVPFLDKDVVEWCFRLPGDVLLPPGQPTKHLLRHICGKYYSAEQLTDQKRGFTPPFASWLQGPLKEKAKSYLALTVSELGLPKARIDFIWNAFARQPQSAAWSRVWALVALGHWTANLNRVGPPAAHTGLWERPGTTHSQSADGAS